MGVKYPWRTINKAIYYTYTLQSCDSGQWDYGHKVSHSRHSVVWQALNGHPLYALPNHHRRALRLGERSQYFGGIIESQWLVQGHTASECQSRYTKPGHSGCRLFPYITYCPYLYVSSPEWRDNWQPISMILAKDSFRLLWKKWVLKYWIIRLNCGTDMPRDDSAFRDLRTFISMDISVCCEALKLTNHEIC